MNTELSIYLNLISTELRDSVEVNRRVGYLAKIT